ncbi:unnamed protein product [Brachionus calyciflorus]|uniref:Uncharacterized protein n=1 Tax=Brachionus calyciflorus TaxID=104777 RepID=A0A813QB21_9BILA|nr:unnamed protein product [Brachionus calyciflorus]
MSETLIDSKNDILLNLNILSKPKYYRLKININGFRFEDIRVSLIEKDADRVQVKISAFRALKSNNQDTTKEYIKYYDIFKSKSCIRTNTMRYYLDSKNPLYLIIEFNSNSDESVHVNLDDSCESLIETAAKSLLNVKNIEDLRKSINDPFNTTLNPEIDEIFSLNLLKDLNLATKTTFTPIKIVQNKNGKTIVRVDVNLPLGINSASLDTEKSVEETNHVKIKFNGLELNLNAISVNENTTSTFSKKFNLPKGTNTKDIVYYIDNSKHSLVIEAGYLG